MGTPEKKKSSKKGKARAKPLSLYPLSVDEITAGMLQTPPMPKEDKEKTEKPRERKVKPSNQ